MFISTLCCAYDVLPHAHFIYSVVFSQLAMTVLFFNWQVHKTKKQVMSEIILKSKFYKVMSNALFYLPFHLYLIDSIQLR